MRSSRLPNPADRRPKSPADRREARLRRPDRGETLSLIKDGDGKYRSRSPAALLACHDALDRNLMALLLTGRGYRVTSCEDGDAALKQTTQNHFDIVVTALSMPHVDGLELVRSLRRREDPVPIMVVGTKGDEIEDIFLRCAALYGADQIYSGPLNFVRILDEADGLVGRIRG